MKQKLFYLVTLLLCMPVGMFAYEQIGQLNPYAYAVEAESQNGILSVTYKLNAPADSTILAIYCDGVEVGTQAVEDNSLGSHSAVVDFTQFTHEGDYTVGIRVYKQSYDAPFQLKEIIDGSIDTTALCYAFFHPKGVDIDRNPFSPYFGRILTAEAMQDTPDVGYRSSADKCGLYAFDATFSPIDNGNTSAFKGGIEYATRMSNGTTHAYAPYRIRISKDGRIFVSMQDDRMSPLYEVSADLQTWTPIFSNALTDGVALDADGNYITGINCGLDVRGEGEDLEIIMLNCNTNAFSSYSGNDFMIATYKLGTATSWSGAATTADTLSAVVGSEVVPVAANCGIAYDETEGYWYIGNRAAAIAQRALVHVDAAGVADWALSENDSVLFSLNGNGLNGGGNARLQDGMLIIGTGQRVGGTGHMQIFDVNHAAGSAPVLTKKYEMDLIGISRNLNDFAIDYGHNLYTIGNSNEKIVPVALPYDGMVETPVAAEILVEALDNINGDAKVQKVIENGQVVIIKNGVRYNALGTVLQ